jgi:hypothetical protein
VIFLVDSCFAVWCASVSFWRLGCSDALPLSFGEARCYLFLNLTRSDTPFTFKRGSMFPVFKI